LDVHIPTNLFVDFCAAFNKLIEYAKLLDKQDSWGYILNRLPMVERNSASYSKFNKRELQDILAENLECLRKIEHVAADDFEFIFRGYISFAHIGMQLKHPSFSERIYTHFSQLPI